MIMGPDRIYDNVKANIEKIRKVSTDAADFLGKIEESILQYNRQFNIENDDPLEFLKAVAKNDNLFPYSLTYDYIDKMRDNLILLHEDSVADALKSTHHKMWAYRYGIYGETDLKKAAEEFSKFQEAYHELMRLQKEASLKLSEKRKDRRFDISGIQ